MLADLTPEQRKAAAQIREWRLSPLRMVRELFNVEPDEWQKDALEAFPHNPRVALKACVGPGKTFVMAMLGWNFMLTRPHPIVGCLSTTAQNLKTNLWTELARWREKAPLLKQTFEQTNSTIFNRQHPKTWKMEARSFPKEAQDSETIGSALAGIHADYVMWLLDETGDYPAALLPVVEGIFAGNPKEARIVQAGNPLRRSGPLYIACYTARKLWHVVEITGDPEDPKRSPRISIDHAREQIELWGRDNPWVKVRILGQFPDSDINALIGEDEVREAMKRFYRPDQIGQAAKILGVDVARFGDDASVAFPREGIQAYPLQKKRNVDSLQGAGWIARLADDWPADGIMIDVTGGYGAGWYDQLLTLGHAPIGVQFAGEAHNKARYYNKRAEMAFEAVDWIKRGGALPLPDGQVPELSELFKALTQTTFTFKGDRFLIEPKEQLKERLGFSPDEFDGLILTFAEPVKPKGRQRRSKPQHSVHYDPFSQAVENSMNSNYDPFGEMQK